MAELVIALLVTSIHAIHATRAEKATLFHRHREAGFQQIIKAYRQIRAQNVRNFPHELGVAPLAFPKARLTLLLGQGACWMATISIASLMVAHRLRRWLSPQVVSLQTPLWYPVVGVRRTRDRHLSPFAGSFVMGASGGERQFEAKAMYELLAGIRTPTKAFYLGGAANTSSSPVAQYSSNDFNVAGADGRLPRKRAFLLQDEGMPVELGPDVLMTVPDPTRPAVAVFKAPAGDTKDGATAGSVEIWGPAGFERAMSLGSASGPALADPILGGGAWSPDGTSLLFVADPKAPTGAHWGPVKDGDPTDPDGLSLKYRQRPDWGEQYTGKACAPKAWVLHVPTGKVRCLGDPDDATLTCGQPIWLSNSRVAFVGWRSPVRLGLIYCHQRASALYAVDVPVDADTEPAPPTQLTSGPLDFSTRSPRLRPDGNALVFLSRESVGPHFTAARLRELDLASLKVRTVVDVVAAPLDGAFPGIYATNLPRQCWLGPHELVTSTQWGCDEALVRVDLTTGAVTRVASPLPGPVPSSVTVLDVHPATGRLVASASSYLTPPDVYEWCLEAGAWRRLHAPHPGNAAAALAAATAGITVDVLTLPTDDGVGAASFESLVLRPTAAAAAAGPLAAGPLPPLVLFAHGGPHSAIPSHWALGPLLLAASGYVVGLPNFRGSTGYGEAALDSLPGKIGDQDVRDCMALVDHLIAAGAADGDRLAAVGGSHGGFLSAHLTSQPALAPRFKAAVMRNPVTDLVTCVGTSDIEDWALVEAGVGTEAERRACAGGLGAAALTEGLTAADWGTLWDKSPMKNVRHVRAATLMLLGQEDRRVHPLLGRNWVRALRAMEGAVPVECCEYPNNSHPLEDPFAAADLWVNTLVWLRRHV